MMLIERFKLMRIAWQAADDSTGLLHAVIDGVRVQLKVHGKTSSPVCTVFYGLSEIDLEEMPARWSIPIASDSQLPESKRKTS